MGVKGAEKKRSRNKILRVIETKRKERSKREWVLRAMLEILPVSTTANYNGQQLSQAGQQLQARSVGD